MLQINFHVIHQWRQEALINCFDFFRSQVAQELITVWQCFHGNLRKYINKKERVGKDKKTSKEIQVSPDNYCNIDLREIICHLVNWLLSMDITLVMYYLVNWQLLQYNNCCHHLSLLWLNICCVLLQNYVLHHQQNDAASKSTINDLSIIIRKISYILHLNCINVSKWILRCTKGKSCYKQVKHLNMHAYPHS